MKLVHGGDTVGYRERYGHDALDFFGERQPAGRAGWRAPSARRRFRRINTPIRSAAHYRAALSQTECAQSVDSLRKRRGGFDFPAGSGGKSPSMCWFQRRRSPNTRRRWKRSIARFIGICRGERNDFALTDDVLNAIEPPIDRVFLCQPNNPTGQEPRTGRSCGGFWRSARPSARGWRWTSASSTFCRMAKHGR